MLENQEQNKEVISMENTTIENQEAESTTLKLQNTINKEELEAKINTYKTKVADISNIVAKLSVPYNDLSVLFTKSEELEWVNKYFKSVSCRDKGIETLLYEMIAYSLVKTAKLNKAFILKGNGRNRQI